MKKLTKQERIAAQAKIIEQSARVIEVQNRTIAELDKLVDAYKVAMRETEILFFTIGYLSALVISVLLAPFIIIIFQKT